MFSQKCSSTRRALFLFFAINLFLPLLFYIFKLDPLLRIAIPHPSFGQKLLLLGYIFSLTFVVSLFLFALFYPLFCLFHSRFLKGLWSFFLVFLEATFLLYFLLNNMVYQFLGIHLDSGFVFDALLNPNVHKETQFSAGSFALLFLSAFFFLLLEGFLLWMSFYLTKREIFKKNRLGGWAILLFVLGYFLTINSIYTLKRAHRQDDPITRAFPLSQRLFGETTKGIQLKVSYPAPQARHFPRLKRRKNIIFILAESLRSDMMTSKQMPHLMNFQRRHACLHSQHHFSGAHCTTWGIFSVLYGLYSYHFKFFHDENVPSYPIALLKKNGYLTVGYTASLLKGWDHGSLLAKQFDRYEEFKKLKSYQNDALLLKRVEQFNKRRDPKRPFFLFIFLDSTHHNYLYPPQFERHKPVMPENYNHFMANQKLRKFRTKIFNRYKNSVLYVDHLFGRLMKIFRKEIERDNLVIAFSGDHGEEFWDHGLLGHGAPRFIKARTQVPLLFCLPGMKKKTVPISSHADLWPTVLDYLGMKPQLPLLTFSNGVSLLRKHRKDRYLVITSYGYPYKRRLLALINDKHKFWLKWHQRFNHFKLLKRTDLEDRLVSPAQSKEAYRFIKRLERDMMAFFREKKFIFQHPPRMKYPAHVRFGPYLELVSFSMDKTKVSRGDIVHFSYLFKALSPIPKGWKFFFHLEVVHPHLFHNLRHRLLGGAYPLHKWQKGQYILDEHWVQIPYFFPKSGKLRLYVGMWAKGKKRQPVHLRDISFHVTKTRRLLLKEFTLTPKGED